MIDSTYQVFIVESYIGEWKKKWFNVLVNVETDINLSHSPLDILNNAIKGDMDSHISYTDIWKFAIKRPH